MALSTNSTYKHVNYFWEAGELAKPLYNGLYGSVFSLTVIRKVIFLEGDHTFENEQRNAGSDVSNTSAITIAPPI